MEATIARDPALDVRRAFKAGRPPKKDQLHTGLNALGLATQMLKELREEMTRAKLLPEHAQAQLIFCFPESEGDRVRVLDIVPREVEANVHLLMRPDVLPLGVLFTQFDAFNKKQHYWTKHFMNGPSALQKIKRVLDTNMMTSGPKN